MPTSRASHRRPPVQPRTTSTRAAPNRASSTRTAARRSTSTRTAMVPPPTPPLPPLNLAAVAESAAAQRHPNATASDIRDARAIARLKTGIRAGTVTRDQLMQLRQDGRIDADQLAQLLSYAGWAPRDRGQVLSGANFEGRSPGGTPIRARVHTRDSTAPSSSNAGRGSVARVYHGNQLLTEAPVTLPQWNGETRDFVGGRSASRTFANQTHIPARLPSTPPGGTPPARPSTPRTPSSRSSSRSSSPRS